MVEQLHERGEKVIQNIRVRAKKQRADIEAEAAPPPPKKQRVETPKQPREEAF